MLINSSFLGTRKKTQRKRFTDLTTHNLVHDGKRSCEQRNSDPYLIPLCSSHTPEWVKVTQSCLTLCNPMDYTVLGILQDRMLESAVFPFSRGSSQPRDKTQVSCIAGRFFNSWATREAQENTIPTLTRKKCYLCALGQWQNSTLRQMPLGEQLKELLEKASLVV